MDDGLRQRQGFLYGLPVWWTAAAVEIDFAPHLVVAGLRCSNKDDAAGVLPKLLRVVAFAAARATKHESHRLPAGWAALRRLWRRAKPWREAG